MSSTHVHGLIFCICICPHALGQGPRELGLSGCNSRPHGYCDIYTTYTRGRRHRQELSSSFAYIPNTTLTSLTSSTQTNTKIFLQWNNAFSCVSFIYNFFFFFPSSFISLLYFLVRIQLRYGPEATHQHRNNWSLCYRTFSVTLSRSVSLFFTLALMFLQFFCLNVIKLLIMIIINFR